MDGDASGERQEDTEGDKTSWYPVAAWEDYEDSSHRKRAIVIVLLPSGVDSYKVIPDGNRDGILFSVKLPSFVMDSSRVLGAIYQDIPLRKE